MRYESASERWSPVQGVRSVLLSVLSLLHEPNPDSGADIEVSAQKNRLTISAPSYIETTGPNLNAEFDYKLKRSLIYSNIDYMLRPELTVYQHKCFWYNYSAYW